MKAFVDKEECTGCGICCESCPAVFSFDDEGKAEAIAQDLNDEQLECAQEAADECPMEAISIK